jgi:superoxide dismutase, Fe-Mn family
MHKSKTYKARDFNLSGLQGISDKTLEMHFCLYQGYVKNTNHLNEKIDEALATNADSAIFSELKRALGFEYNGMVLHEYYFGNLKKNGGGDPESRSAFRTAIQSSFDSYESWKKEFAAVGSMRGVGWAICYQDPATGILSNHWITLHQDGNVAGFEPVLVMDVWEHAFILDYRPADRSKYIEAFFSNIDWSAVERRLKTAQQGAAISAGR